MLFNRDVEGASLSFHLVDELRAVPNPANNTATMYHASCFVCAVHRARRLLESLSANRACFRDAVAEVIQLEWRKKHTFLESFRDPRDAIEHVDGEASDNTKWSFFNLHNDRFCVADGISVEINRASLDRLCSARDGIAEAIIKEYRDSALDFLNTVMKPGGGQ